MAKKTASKMNIAIIHPDLGIGGAERLVASHGHKVHIFTAHHDKNRCFEETISGTYCIRCFPTSAHFLPSSCFMCIYTVVFYCHFLEHTNFLRRLFRKPIDLVEETAGKLSYTLKPLVPGGFDKRLRENVEYLEELKNLAEKEGVSKQVTFIMSCSTSERNVLLSQCLCVLYTPKDEHFGIVPLEAMAAQKPVIGCNSGGPVETIKNGVTGYLCDPNPREFSMSMAKFIQDPQMAERMGIEARRHVIESFSTKIFGQRLSQYLVDVTQNKID
ncbi:hypothetical protein FNV43_RR16315 [Rhamnella rubrinervis]|uniref:Alpha-1,3/1,6-mannosyltransferase ALG2 n=1 Tax=Rhamnella rubrinervis TaxID=2594499 RepID=A0A8K0MBR9_9ROSA|nr:hypothetical protein FNV43_RR16315 [Rhamnella rubrinervis]